MRSSIFIVLLLFSCSTKKESGYSHLLEEKTIKSKQVDGLPIDYQLFRVNATQNKLYFRIDPNDFLSMRDSSGIWSVEIGINLKIKNNGIGGNSFDLQKDTVIFDKLSYSDSLSFEFPAFKNAHLELTVSDRNKHIYQLYSRYLERELDFIPEDISLWSENCNCLVNSTFIELGNAKFHGNQDLSKDLQLEVFQNLFYPADNFYNIKKLPNDDFIKPTNEFIGTLEQISKEVNELRVESYCRISENAEEKKNYPSKFQFTIRPNLPAESIAPLIYLIKGDDKKIDVTLNDWTYFWSQASNNDEAKAEELIKEFFRRVKYTNQNYGSYKQGWKTDRGMLYILMGKPDRVQDDVRGEIWLYGFSEVNATQFRFERNLLGLNSNDFTLERSLNYREIWQSAVLKWENGWVKIDEF